MEDVSRRLREWLIARSALTKRAIVLSADVCLIPLALWLAFFARLGTDHLINPLDYHWLFLASVATALPAFHRFGLYTVVFRYLGRGMIVSVFKSVTLSALLLALTIYWIRSDLLIPRMLVANYWVILGLLVGGVRFAALSFLVPEPDARGALRSLMGPRTPHDRRPVAIYGAGAAGYQLYRSLQHDREITPVAFIDDDPDLWGRSIGGIRVYGATRIDNVMELTGMREIFFAIPSIDPARRMHILEHLQQFPVRVRTVPSVYELTTGRKRLAQLEDVRVEDLLGREVVQPRPHLLNRCVRGKTVMVTGAGGSIGSELCRQIVELEPHRIVLLDQSEFNLFQIDEELREDATRRDLAVDIVPVLASVTDRDRLESIIRQFSIDTIYHAAAYKHVPIVERNVAPGVLNNVIGTLHAAQAALGSGVENFVLISTDKAVRPTSIMGATKRLAEMILQALARKANAGQATTRFTMVRFGNVIGSSGSVIPKFRQQIRSGGPLTVTHPEVTRYFMTIPEAAQLVIQAGSMGNGGDVFLLDMGQPVRILDLAIKLIRLSGLTVRDTEHPEGDIEIRITGLRPGEKLYEELLIGGATSPTDHPQIQRAEEETLDWSTLEPLIEELLDLIARQDSEAIIDVLARNVDGFERHHAEVEPVRDATPTSTSAPANVLVLEERSQRNAKRLS